MSIVIIGAGMAGLAAGRELGALGREVVILDKGRGVGGRMATRRFAGGRFDTGAQFFSARSRELRKLLEEELLPSGAAREWYRRGEESYHRGGDGMTAVAKQLARGLEVRTGQRVTSITRGGGGWKLEVETQDGESYRLETPALLATPPVPQTLALLAGPREHLEQEPLELLEGLTYSPTLALLLLLEGNSPLPAPGYARTGGELERIYWVADNRQKGVSEAGPAITIHAQPEYSRSRYEEPESSVIEELEQEFINAFPPGGGYSIVARQLKKWRYARPENPLSKRSCLLSVDPPLVVAGDAFGGARVEGAYLSGLAAAAVIEKAVN